MIGPAPTLTENQMGEWLGRDLNVSAIDLAVLTIVHVGDNHVLLVALGFDARGNEHVLGVRDGAMENAASFTALLTEMRPRSAYRPSCARRIDGVKAVANAIRDCEGHGR